MVISGFAGTSKGSLTPVNLIFPFFAKSYNPLQYSRLKSRARSVQGFVVRNEAIPGPLFMSGEDGDFLKGVKSAGSFIKFPVR